MKSSGLLQKPFEIFFCKGPNLTSLHQRKAERKQGSIGKPNFYVHVRIVDDNGNDVTFDQPGELMALGPMVTPGYWQSPEATKNSQEDGWFKTGDMARMDPEGFIYIMDRKKHMYISGDENVYHVEVERVLLEHGAMKEVVVIGVPHKKWGECGAALIVKDGKVTQEEMQKYCIRKLAKFKVPSQVHFINSVPKGDTGKVDRKKLKNLFLSKGLV